MGMTSYDGKVGSIDIFTERLHLCRHAVAAIAAATVTTASTTTSIVIFTAITTSITFHSSN
eukprot:10450958-Ditylum_brightwellii.AAC.1